MKRRRGFGDSASKHNWHALDNVREGRAALRTAKEALDKGDCARALGHLMLANQYLGRAEAESDARHVFGGPDDTELKVREFAQAVEFVKERYKRKCQCGR